MRAYFTFTLATVGGAKKAAPVLVVPVMGEYKPIVVFRGDLMDRERILTDATKGSARGIKNVYTLL